MTWPEPGDLAEIEWRAGNDPEPFLTSMARRGLIGWTVLPEPPEWEVQYASDKDCRAVRPLSVVPTGSLEALLSNVTYLNRGQDAYALDTAIDLTIEAAAAVRSAITTKEA